jgi:hypothetical protein
MYFIIGMFILAFTWMGFITKILLSILQDNQLKKHNQKFHESEVEKLKKKVHEHAR